MFSRIVDRLVRDETISSEHELGLLFQYLATDGPRPERGLYKGPPFVDGQLFDRVTRVHLLHDELVRLRRATTFDWHRVEPAIFGSILEGALGRERVWNFGAHYTSADGVMKVVGSTIVEPWLELLDRCESIAAVAAAKERLAAYRVLDPGVRFGNFLYVSYHELRR